MRPTVITLILATVVAPAACAPPAADVSQLLPPGDQQELQRLLPGVDVDSLTPGQQAAIANELHSNQDKAAGGRIRAILY